MTEHVVQEIVDAVVEIRGAAAGKVLEVRGVERLHEVVDALDIRPIRSRVIDRMRSRLLRMAVAVGREVLGWDHDFFVDDYLILRINFPYEVARLASPDAENPGVGRVSPSVQELFQSRKVIDPVYDPRAYHRGHPPAAWAHGPHLDSWAGHSRDGRNIWWAIGEVPPEAGMVLYPELADRELPPEPRTLYLKAGYALPKPTCLPLQSGEMLVFDPEVLHGTHLNTTDGTRVAVSMRLNDAKPTFDPGCFYAREFWRRSTEIERGHDEVLHLRREENLGPARQPVAHTCSEVIPRIPGLKDPGTGEIVVELDHLSGQPNRAIVEVGAERLMVFREDRGWSATAAACPHYGLDLADGWADERSVYCPGCAVAFDRRTGRSACSSLRLTIHETRLTDGMLRIRVG